MKGKEQSAAFLKLSKKEEQLREDNSRIHKANGMTIASRLVLFFMFPLFIGSLGLLCSHIQHKFSKEPRPMNFDRDFVYPFLITLVLVVVVSIQTGNFASYEAKPLVSWPKVVKKQKITRKTVVIDDDGNVVEDESILENLKTAAGKKDN